MSLEAKTAAAKSLVKEQIAAARAEDVCVTSSFQTEDMVVVHLVREVMGKVPVIFLDTGYHFAETYEYRDRLSKEWDLNLVNVLPQLTVAEQESMIAGFSTRLRLIVAVACAKLGRCSPRLSRTALVHRSAAGAGKDARKFSRSRWVYVAHG